MSWITLNIFYSAHSTSYKQHALCTLKITTFTNHFSIIIALVSSDLTIRNLSHMVRPKSLWSIVPRILGNGPDGWITVRRTTIIVSHLLYVNQMIKKKITFDDENYVNARQRNRRLCFNVLICVLYLFYIYISCTQKHVKCIYYTKIVKLKSFIP